jgi:hypothetical protein
MIPPKLLNDFAFALAKVPITSTKNGRDTLLLGLPEPVIASLPRDEGGRLVDLKIILMHLEPQGRLKDGVRPLMVIAQNALGTVTGTALGDTLEDIANKLEDFYGRDHPSKEVPPIPEAFPSGRDERLEHSCVLSALVASRSVARLRVPQIFEGKYTGPANDHFGTGWVAAPGILMTNHHVIAARKESPLPLSDADFEAQAAATRAWFKYYKEGLSENIVEVRCTKLLAKNEGLDYAVLRMESPDHLAPRPWLTIAKETPDFALGARLNIVQCAAGGPIRYALTGNYFVSTGGTLDRLRYLTDTDAGASGAPVFDETWRVVAMHHGYHEVPQEVHQGKVVKYHNQGVVLNAILKHLPDDLRNEVSQAQGWK